MTIKQYLLFCGDYYYPIGGMCDCQGSFDSIEEARTNIQNDCDWFQIVDLETMEVIE